MSTKARRTFDQSAKEVDRLLEIHQTLGGDATGRRYRLEVLNKSAVVLITAIWEAYCEDLAAEALGHIVKHAKTSQDLPKDLRKRVAKELEADANELAVWQLSDKGWRDYLKARLAAMAAERNRRLNTPKAQNIDELMETAIGLKNVSASWNWTKMPADRARDKLDKYVQLRGEIAHRGQGAKSVKKSDVEDYFGHVRKLVAKTGGRANTFVKRHTGNSLW